MLIFARVEWRMLVARAGVALTFLLVPLWYRLPNLPAWMPDLYVSRFLLVNVMVVSLGLWLVVGLPRLRAVRWRASWIVLLLALALWMFASGAWAFMRDRYPELAINAAVQLGLTALFALMTVSVASPRVIVVALFIGLVWNSALAGAQVAEQQSVGGLWRVLGEFTISTTQPRVSYLTVEGARWLRPYALLPHPNVLAGFLSVALLACIPLLSVWRGWRWWLLLGVLSVGLWVFMLTFSRGAWLGFGAGGLLLLLILARRRALTRRLMFAAMVAVLLGAAFFVTYRPYLLARAGMGEENVELYSLGERELLIQAADQAIREHPVNGVGAGNFGWWASYYFFERDIPLRGNNVHVYPLLAWAEVGVIGAGLAVSAMLIGVVLGLRDILRDLSNDVLRSGLLVGFVALTVSGLFDHYTWTLPQMQVLWWGGLAGVFSLSDP